MTTDAVVRAELTPSVLSLASSCEVGNVEVVAQRVVERADAGLGGYVCLCNVHLLTVALHRDDVRQALEAAWLRLPDGAPVAWMQRRLGLERAQRVPGPDLMPKVVDLARERGLRHFLFGSTSDVGDRVRIALEERFPGSAIVGRYSPAFSDDAQTFADAVEVIRASSPHIVWCALGAPKQELWMHRFASELNSTVFLGVGAAFDFLAASKRRAPAWMQRGGLEWFHRLLSEPSRLGGRYVRTNTEFMLRSVHELARERLTR